MSLNFERNSYSNVADKNFRASNEGILPPLGVVCEEETTESWFGRTIAALSEAIWPETTKTVNGLAEEIIFDQTDSPSNNKNNFKPQTSYTKTQPSSKQSVIDEVRKNPNSFSNLSYNLRNDPDVVVAALSGCTSAWQAEEVIDAACPNAKNYEKVALAAIKIDPTLIEKLSYGVRNDPDIVAAALNACRSSLQAEEVIDAACPNAKNYEKVALAAIKIDPTLIEKLSYGVRNDPDIVAAALNACRSSLQAEEVIDAACPNAKNYEKVALAAIKIDPTLIEKLSYGVRNDPDIVAAALNACRSSLQAEEVINAAHSNAKNSKKVALALIKIDPTLIEELGYSARNDLDVILLAIELSTTHTIHKIWNSVGSDAAFNETVRAKVRSKYPHFFQNSSSSSNTSSSNTRSNPNHTSYTTAPKTWSEPSDLKNNTSDEANIIRRILKQSYLQYEDLITTDVSKSTARDVLRRLLELDKNASDTELKTAYKKTALRIHPDKLKLQSGELAFKMLTAAYKQAEL